MRDRIHDLTRRVRDLPTLPAVYQQIEAITRDPSASSLQVAQIIGRDPVLTARLLRVANSARYALTERVTTVTRAVSILGHRTVRESVLVTSVLSLLPNEPSQRAAAEGFWRHALAVGTTAQVLGDSAGGPVAEECFIGGLLHDIGKLIWLRYFPEDLQAIQAAALQTNIAFLDAEMAMVGTSHVRLGRMLARRWRLPELYQDTIGFHHEVSAGGGNALLCAIVQAADAIAHALELGGASPLRMPGVQTETWAAVRFDPDTLPTLLDTVQAEFQEGLDLFPLSLNEGVAEALPGDATPLAPAMNG